MQTASELCPTVKPTHDRNVFKVTSRSHLGTYHRVDGEARFGLMACNCDNYVKGNNPNCWHILQVRKFVACVAMQYSLNQPF